MTNGIFFDKVSMKDLTPNIQKGMLCKIRESKTFAFSFAQFTLTAGLYIIKGNTAELKIEKIK